MCTAIRIPGFAGRNLDIERGYGERIIITPRNYGLSFKRAETIRSHYAFFGIGVIDSSYPLYFDAANEKGLYAAGLNYLENAKYKDEKESFLNLAPYELIPYLLATCASVGEVKSELARINVCNIPLRAGLPVAQLHFFIADKERSIAVEPDENRINVYDNPTDVLTNNPPFPMQLFNLNDYSHLSPSTVKTSFCNKLKLQEYSGGLGAIGLPGDLSSKSRFVRAAFHRLNTTGEDSIAKIMRLLASVEMPEGSLKNIRGFERTEYVSAVDLSSLSYVYRSYDSLLPYCVRLTAENLDLASLISYPVIKNTEPLCQNDSTKSIYKI